jgi:inner membrane protein
LAVDNVTHALFGLGIYGVWSMTAAPTDIHSTVATGCLAASILGSEAPDFDILVRVLAGPTAYLRQHRALSHSVLVWPLWGMLMALGVDLWIPGHFIVYFLLAFIGVIIHVGLDVLTTYGTQALWPFNGKRLAYDALFIVDLVLIGFGVLALLCVWRGWSIGQATITFGLLTAAYIFARLAQSLFRRRILRVQFPSEWVVSAIPGPLPWWWSYVAQSRTELIAGRMRGLHSLEPQVIWKSRPPSDVVSYVLNTTKTGRVFKWFARHLLWTESEDEGKIRITLADATYRYGRTLPFTSYVEVKLSDQGNWRVHSESIRGQRIDATALVKDALDPNDSPSHDIQMSPPSGVD